MSTKVFAAGCTMSSNFMMVAPSLEMVTWPLLSTMSLSMPLGPSVVLTVSTTAAQALMLDSSWPLPCDVSVPSFKRMICGCYRINSGLVLGRHTRSKRHANSRRPSHPLAVAVHHTRREASAVRVAVSGPDLFAHLSPAVITCAAAAAAAALAYIYHHG